MVTVAELRKHPQSELRQVLKLTKFARAKLAAPKGWIKGTNGKTKTGKSVPETNRYAVSFCARGALLLAAKRTLDLPRNTWTESAKAYNLATTWVQPKTKNYYSSLISWNDSNSRTQKEVVSAFDALIAKVSGVLAK